MIIFAIISFRGINPMDQDHAKDDPARRSGITWGGGRRRSNLASDRWRDSYTSQGPDWLRGPIPAVRDYGPSYEVTTTWGKMLVVAGGVAVLVAMFIF